MKQKKVNVQMIQPQQNSGIRTIDTTVSQDISKPNVSGQRNIYRMQYKNKPMIAAKELRIANWVNELGESFYTPIQVSIKLLGQIESGEKDFQPIPLTPEILEKCGFERMPLTSVKRWFNKETIFYLQLSKSKYFVYGYKFYPHGITYLHQLQNLYFFLTGKELIYKP
jgi:hypothetical protein